MTAVTRHRRREQHMRRLGGRREFDTHVDQEGCLYGGTVNGRDETAEVNETALMVSISVGSH